MLLICAVKNEGLGIFKEKCKVLNWTNKMGYVKKSKTSPRRAA
jgi:hypothetical protein